MAFDLSTATPVEDEQADGATTSNSASDNNVFDINTAKPVEDITVYDPETSRVISGPSAATAGEFQYHDAVQNQGASPRDAVGYTKPEPLSTMDTIGKWFNMPMSAAMHGAAQLEMDIPKAASYLLRLHAASNGSTTEEEWAAGLTKFDNKVDAGLEKDVQFYHDKMGFGFDVVGGVLNIPTYLAAGPATVAGLMGLGGAEGGYEQAKKAGKSEGTSLAIGGGVGAINAAMQTIYLGRLSAAVQSEAKPLISKLISAGTNAIVTGTTGTLAQEGLLQATGVSNKSAGEVAADVAKTVTMFATGEGVAHGAHEFINPTPPKTPNIHPTDTVTFPNGVRYTDTDPTSEGFKVAKEIDAQSGVDLQPRPKADGTVQNPDGTTSLSIKLPGQEPAQEPTAPKLLDSTISIMHQAATGQITPEVAKTALEAVGHPSPDAAIAKLPEVQKIISDKADQLIQEDIQKANDNPQYVTDTLKAMQAAHEGDSLTLKALIQKEGGEITPELQDLFNEMEARKVVQKAKEAEQVSQAAKVDNTDPQVIAARTKKLDSDLSALDQRIDDQMTRISDLNKAGRSQKAAENKLEKMLNDRSDMADELAGLETADTKTVAQSKSGKKITEQQTVASESLSKDVTVKGEVLAKAARDKARSRAQAIYRGIRSGKVYGRDETRAVQSAVIRIVNDFIKNSSHLDNTDKAKFLVPLRDMNTFDKLQKNFPKILSMLRNAEGKATASSARATINKELASSKPQTQSGKKVGKFTVEIQDHLDTLARYNKMSQEEASNELAARLDSNADFSADQKMENRMLGAIASGKQTAPHEWQALAEHIQQAKAEGKTLRQQGKDEAYIAAEEIRTEIHKNVPQAKELYDMSSFKEALKKGANIRRWLADNWIEFANKIAGTNAKIKAALYVDKNYVAYKAGKQESLPKLDEMIQKARGEADQKERRQQQYKDLRRKYITDPASGEPMEFVNARGQKVKLKYSVAEARSFMHDILQGEEESYTDPKGKYAYTKPMMDAVKELLGEKDHAQIKAQQEFLDNYYERVNAIYSKLNGVNLGKPENYFPIRRVGDTEPNDVNKMLDPFQGDSRPTVSPSSLKARTGGKRGIIQRADSSALMEHIDKTERYIAFAEKLKDIQRIFNDPELKRTLDEKFGGDFRNYLNSHLESMANGGIRDYTPLNRAMNRLYSNYAFAKLAFKATLGLKHFSLIMAFPSEMPTVDFVKGMADFAAHPKEAMKNLMTSPVMKSRYGGDYDSTLETRIITQQAQQYSTWLGRQLKNPNFINFAQQLGQIGHQAATMIGGHSYYKYLTEKGLDDPTVLRNHEHEIVKAADGTIDKYATAMRMVENLTNETQQSGDPDRLSLYQKSQAGRMLGIFTSAPMGLFRMERRIVSDFGNDWKSASTAAQKTAASYRMARRLAIVHVGGALLYQAINSAFSSGEEADKAYKARAVMGPLEGLPIIGNWMQAASNALFQTEESKYATKLPGMPGAINSAYEDANKMFKKLGKIMSSGDGMDHFHTWLDMAKAMYKPATDVAALAGFPDFLDKSLPQAIMDLHDGDSKAGLLEVAGYPKSVAHAGEAKSSKSKERGINDLESPRHSRKRKEKGINDL